MSTNKSALPRVPKGLPKDQELFLTKVREVLDIQAGKGRGDALDRAITYRDWLKANGSLNLKAQLQLDIDDDDDIRYNDPEPMIPTGVECLPTIETVLCMWDRVSGDWYASTQILRAAWDRGPNKDGLDENGDTIPRPDYTQAVQVGSVASPFFTDFIPANTRVIYWIRHVNRDGVTGPFHDIAGTVATTYENPIDVIREYSQDVYNGDAYKWIRSSIGMMDSIQRAYAAAGVSEDSGLFALLSRSDDLMDLLAEQAIADSLDKAQQRFELQAQFSKNYARLSGGVHAAVNNDEAYVNRIAVLESNWAGIDATINAKISEYDLTLSSNAGGIATSIQNYTVSYDGNEVTLQELASAVANNQGEFIAQWGVKSSVNGLQRGVGFVNNGSFAEFVVDVDRFAITGGTSATDDTPIAPFIVRDGKVFMSEAFIDTAVVAALIAEEITASRIVANVELISPVINGGSITGTTLNINNKFSVNASGFMQATDAYVEGHITASSGTLDNVLINDTCTVNGTVYARNIEGDVYDATSVGIQNRISIGANQQATIYSITLKGVPYYQRIFQTSIVIDHDNGGGSTSNCYIRLYRNGALVASLYQTDNTESGQINAPISCIIPIGTADVTIDLVVRTDSNDVVGINPQFIPAAVFKRGGSIKSVTTGGQTTNSTTTNGVDTSPAPADTLE